MTWSHAGKILEEASFRHGLLHGLRRVRAIGGQVTERTYRRGRQTGPVLVRAANGQPRALYHQRGALRRGPSLEWWPDGEVRKAAGVFIDRP